MPAGSISPAARSARDMVLRGASVVEVQRWMGHHLKGDWFTSDLLRLIAKADISNRHKLENAFPDEFTIWSYWMARRDMPAMAMEVTGG